MRKNRVDMVISIRQYLGMTDLHTPAQIIDHIGHERAAEALGVPVKTVLRYRWADRGKLPAAWLDALEGAAKCPLPREVFSFKRAGQ